MRLTPETAAYAQRDFLYSLFKAQTNVDDLGNVDAGTNINGQLRKVASLGRKSIFPNFEALPFVGVQLMEQREKGYAQLKHELRTTIKVGVTVSAVALSNGIIKTDDAFDALELLVDDGNGNGVCPIIRAHDKYTLGSTNGQINAEMRYLPKIQYDWDKTPISKGVSYFAYAVITIEGVLHIDV